MKKKKETRYIQQTSHAELDIIDLDGEEKAAEQDTDINALVGNKAVEPEADEPIEATASADNGGEPDEAREEEAYLAEDDSWATEDWGGDPQASGEMDEDALPEDTSAGWKSRLAGVNWHLVFAAGVVLVIALVVLRFFTWGRLVDISDVEGDDSEEVQDNIMPLFVKEGHEPVDDGVTTVVAFGNAPFADDRNNPDSLSALIEELSGATVYNCSVADTFLAAQEETFLPDIAPMDAFNFYWLTTLFCMDNKVIYDQAFEAMGGSTPADAREAYETLTSIDFSTVDVITLMYDGSDYLDGRRMYDDENTTDIQTFTGNMEAGIELIESTYPHIRIIVLSPTYAYAVNEEGEYVSSDMYRYGQDVLSTYVLRQSGSSYIRSVTFIDNLYGTVTADNAGEYLTDHIHLNPEGRRLVAERFVYAMDYYKYDHSDSGALGKLTSKQKNVLIPIAVIILAAVIGAGGYFLFRGRRSGKK